MDLLHGNTILVKFIAIAETKELAAISKALCASWCTVASLSTNKKSFVPPATVVTYMSPVEAFVTAIKMFDRQKVCLIAWSFPSEALDHLIFKGQSQKVKLQLHILDLMILAAQRPPWSLDCPPKRALIAWFNFDPGRKRFYTRHMSDYPLYCYAVRARYIITWHHR